MTKKAFSGIDIPGFVRYPGAWSIFYSGITGSFILQSRQRFYDMVLIVQEWD